MKNLLKELLEEIRNQPEHIRHIFMWLCVVITFSLVGFVWFRQTTKQFVALMNPQAEQERVLAEKEKEEAERQANAGQPSPFASILDMFGGLRANISELLAGPEKNVTNLKPSRIQETIPPQKLPIAD